MGSKEEIRIFVGGLSWETTDRDLEDAFSRFGKVTDAQVMLDRDTGRSRGFGFVTFADQRAMESAISEMHGRELGGRVISVNKAEPKLGGSDGPGGYGYRGGGDRFSSRPRFGGPGGGGSRGDRFGGSDRYEDRYVDRYVEDRYDGGRYGDRDGREDRYGGGGGGGGGRDHYSHDRYPPSGDRYQGDRYGQSDYPQNGYAKERGYDRDGGPLAGGSERYVGGAGGRYDGGGGGGGGGGYRERPGSYGGRPGRGGGSFKERSGPYDRPSRGMRPSAYDDRY
ncbi:unnamed protein product [Spirodela intermedia]|uniref:RRM domain-containing protein n=1 Tax=Spirodela intermedia TaxID=51605 RepID=A0A7I8JCV6_SPIIN|nr:unnamed protein product [Spirodela intermedia]CAA6667222.1 unnamed protein product [Spirodela intermedia]